MAGVNVKWMEEREHWLHAIKNSRHLSRFRLHKVSSSLWVFFRTWLLIGLSFILLYPMIYIVSVSFRPPLEVLDPSIVWIPRTLTLDNLQLTFKAMRYSESLINTLTIGGISAMLQVISCGLVGYGFARFKFKERELLFSLVLFSIIVPPQTMLIPTFMLFRNFDFFGILSILRTGFGLDWSLNLINQRSVFYLPSIFGMGLRSGLYIYIYRQFFRGMPKELEDAALIDGCSSFRTFLRVMVPNAGAVILTVFLFSLVWHWNDYFYSAMYMTNRPTIATSLANLRLNLWNFVNVNDPYAMTTRMQSGSLLAIAPLILFYVFAQRFFTESVERTGIVG